jgi:hypothetical protein
MLSIPGLPLFLFDRMRLVITNHITLRQAAPLISLQRRRRGHYYRSQTTHARVGGTSP